MFEGRPTADTHTFTLPNGTEMAITGTRSGAVENPTINGTDDDGRAVEATFETINDQLVLVSFMINGEPQSIDAEPERIAA